MVQMAWPHSLLGTMVLDLKKPEGIEKVVSESLKRGREIKLLQYYWI